LAEAGYLFTVMPPAEDVECGVCSETSPAALVSDLAFRKAAAIVRQLQSKPTEPPVSSPQPPPIVLAADTIAECDGFILGKPRDEADARAMLTRLSGREHRVLTGVCLWRLGDPQPAVRVAVTTLRMDQLTDTQLSEYLASGAWEGKAGAFGYQDRLGWVHILEGSETNVVGLPMELLADMFNELKA
jgi:septum formation protein